VFNSGLDSVDTQRHKGGTEIIEPRREQIGVYGGKLEARVSQVNGSIKRRGLFEPLAAKSGLDFSLAGQ